jgi:polyisoprenoid-binding protein YceI
MTSIAVTDDMPEDKKGYLIGHLAGTTGSDKDADFFQVTKYPTAKFEITEVTPVTKEGATHTVSGNLTMLDKTNNITFDATVGTEGDMLTATTAPFAIDRTKWGITFMSTLAGMIKEKALKDEIVISINLKANAAK